MNRQVSVMLCLAMALGGAVLTAQTAKLRTSWAAPGVTLDFAGKRVVAIALTSDQNVKMSAEEALAREITARGPVGVASYRAIPKEELVDKDRVQQWLVRTGTAGAVVVRVVNVDTTKEYSSVMFGAAYYQSFSGFYDYGMGATRSTEKKSEVTICERRISGSAGPWRFRLIDASLIAARPVKTSCCARQSRKFWGATRFLASGAASLMLSSPTDTS